MSKPPVTSDIIAILKGIQMVLSAAIELNQREVQRTWTNSSVRKLLNERAGVIQETVTKVLSEPQAVKKDVINTTLESVSRASTVVQSIQAYAKVKTGIGVGSFYPSHENFYADIERSEISIERTLKNEFPEEPDAQSNYYDRMISQAHNDRRADDEYARNFQELLNSYKPGEGQISDDCLDALETKINELQGIEHTQEVKIADEIGSYERAVEKARSNQKEAAILGKQMTDGAVEKSMEVPFRGMATLNTVTGNGSMSHFIPLIDASKTVSSRPHLLGKKPLAKEKPKSTLASSAQARKVPESRVGRLISFGGLAAGLGLGTIAEFTRRTLGLKEQKSNGALMDKSLLLSEANARRIVATLCKVRGAALKLGQMLSIQDNSLINPQLQLIFERVRHSADFMPQWQLERVLIQQFGTDWRKKVASFDDRPFAAASIGQVHQAVLLDGRSVAMKIQYPGVAGGIESDINNLMATLNVGNLLPEGLFVESLVDVAKKELACECDYIREKESTRRFAELLKLYPEYYVHEVIDELCTGQVFTSELIEGFPVDKCIDMSLETRNYISYLILKLCLLELFEFRFMQTDPNWSNFFFNVETQQLALLDFGACQEYRKSFVDEYIKIIYGAVMCDREKILASSRNLGFLTGYEAKIMEDAHVDAVMILGEAFRHDGPFYFGSQNTTKRIQSLIPVMLSHRMCAPPPESYSLHRKMSGAFLLCARLDATVNCKPIFDEVWANYKFG